MKEGATKSVLSTSNAVAIMVYLLRSGGSSKGTLTSDAIGINYDSMKSSATRLESEGLLTKKDVPGKSKYTLYELTDLGRIVAQHLDAAERAISGGIN